MMKELCSRQGLKKFIYQRRGRIVAAILLLLAESFFFFGTGALLETETNFLSGEGAWDIVLDGETPAICQEFVPMHKFLHSLGFRMDMTSVSSLDGTVTVSVLDGGQQILFEKTLGYEEITDGAYTDVDVDLELKRGKSHYFVIACNATDETGYPMISVCSKEYKLSESRSLVCDEELVGQHLVSRYCYENALTVSRACKAIFLCIVAATGIFWGLPDNKYVRRVLGGIILLAAPYILGQRLELLTYNYTMYLPIAMKWNIGIIYALELIAVLATHSAGIGMTLANTAVTVLYSANYFMLMYRGTSLRMNDFSAIGTAAKVMDAYDLTPNSHLAMIWGMLIVFVVFGLQTGVPHKKEQREQGGKMRKHIILRDIVLPYGITIVLAVTITLYGGYQLIYTDLFDRVGFVRKDLEGFEYNMIYACNGYLVATCMDIQKSQIVKPEGYSVETAERILKDFKWEDEAVATEDLPHMILIMNESFSDIRVLGDVELSQENMAFVNSLEENTIKGWVNASTFGGGTANSEFEVFTGCSMAFLPINYYPYQQAMNRPVNSMIGWMKQSGYSTVSMHPERAANWNRKNVYQYYGFDRMLWEEDFEGAEEIHGGVSDRETYRRIIETYEAREEGDKLFIFDLTIQNHGGYTDDEAPYAVSAVNLQEQEIDEYLSLIKISDEAFSELVEYFAGQDEKVIICMFGDHQPWVFDLVVDSELTDGNNTLERMMNKYKTPFVIWANYDIDEAEGYDISMNYLGGLLMRTAGIPQSPYFHFLERIQTEYPVITVNGYVDKEGVYHAWGSEQTEFLEYRLLQYNYLFDTDIVEWGF